MAIRYKAKELRRHYIREWLLHLDDMKQAELARRMETSPANVTRWIDEPQRVNLDVLSGVADALGLKDAGDLLRHPALAAAANQIKEAANTISAASATEKEPPTRK